ncbi:MAG: gamma-glutamylcyclotransferase [Candidatus Competibacteraceae bacterium]|nr:gamma-glutamylcyclotransferase [Candidatus Competibacteraceae bacterium]MCB1808802.1 gamma-glutamylcyclotransferase [Candidatus Competibacteraceae bacterium]MCB1813588.1 gamma-glutamylcyclotransferase [Candidatus Competibacteraceae bacterium]
MNREKPRHHLTEHLVSLVERKEPDPGPEPGTKEHSLDDFSKIADAVLEEYSPEQLWLFAYGSLIWNPDFEHSLSKKAVAYGWHRSFCLKLTRWRGTRELPALMLALDEGQSCTGLAYRLSGGDHKSEIIRLLVREIDANPPTNVPRWIDVSTDSGQIRALTFVADPKGPAYAGKLTLAETAWVLARAAGHWGSCAQYLYNTCTKLEAEGIHDTDLNNIKQLVANEIIEMHGL